jgi:hypothetical protein
MAPSTKYNGKSACLMYAAAVDTAPTVDLSGSSREISIDESGNKQDVSTRDDYLANATAYLAFPPTRTVGLNGIDTTPNSSRTWNNVLVGDSGRVAVYPLGSSPTGLPYHIGNVVCEKKGLNIPHDNGGKFSLEWTVNSTWSSGTT